MVLLKSKNCMFSLSIMFFFPKAVVCSSTLCCDKFYVSEDIINIFSHYMYALAVFMYILND